MNEFAQNKTDILFIIPPVNLDRYINPFITEEQSPTNYHLNKEFLLPKWANYTGEVEQFSK